MPEPQIPEATLSNIRSLLDEQMSSSDAPGAALGIVQDGELIEFTGAGTIDVEKSAAPTETSIARVASVTKTFTATAIMQLRDASLLALDDPLLLHIPEFTVAEAVAAPLEAVTIRRMLTHHSGLSTEHPDLDWNAPDFPTLEHVMDSLDKVQVVIPEDSQWKYSNLAYCLLGEVVTRLSGKPYIDYVHDEIISPLGLANTAFDLSPEQEKLRMTGYSPPLPGGDNVRTAPYSHLNGFSAAGQLQTNVEDLAKWVGFHMGGGTESVLSEQSRAEMRRPVYIVDDWSNGQGLGWRAVRKGDHVFWNHGGAVHGFSTSVFLNVPTRTGVILLVNMWPVGWNADLALKIAEIVASDAVAETQSASADPKQEPERVAGEYDGNYFAEPGLPLTVAGTESGLSFLKPEPGEPTLHAPVQLDKTGDPDSFKVNNGRGAGEIAVFERDEAGKVNGMSLGGFRYKKLN